MSNKGATLKCWENIECFVKKMSFAKFTCIKCSKSK